MKNVLTVRKEIANSQTNATVIDPGAGVGLVIDWIIIGSPVAHADGIELSLGNTAEGTVIAHTVTAGAWMFDYRSPSKGSGLAAGAGVKLLATTGTAAGSYKVTVGYHLDNNP